MNALDIRPAIMRSAISLAGVLAYATAQTIPPASFQFPTAVGNNQLSVQYQVNGTSLAVQPGALFGINVPAQQPTIAINESRASTNASYTGQYVLFMLDPDASYPQNPTNRWIVHWWQTGLVKSTTQVNSTSIGGTQLVNNTAPRVSYRRPAPPTNSSAHRYIQWLFEQPQNFQIPAAYSGYNQTNASRFPFEQFVKDANLGAPVAANYFYASNQSVVPGLFVGAPGSQYPGGNGALISNGTNIPTSSASSGGSATSTSTGGLATYTGAAKVWGPNTLVVVFVALLSWAL